MERGRSSGRRRHRSTFSQIEGESVGESAGKPVRQWCTRKPSPNKARSSSRHHRAELAAAFLRGSGVERRDLRWPLVPSFLLWSKKHWTSSPSAIASPVDFRHEEVDSRGFHRGGPCGRNKTAASLAGGRSRLHRKTEKIESLRNDVPSSGPNSAEVDDDSRGQLPPEVRRPTRERASTRPPGDRPSLSRVDELRFTARHILGHFPHVIMHDHVEHIEQHETGPAMDLENLQSRFRYSRRSPGSRTRVIRRVKRPRLSIALRPPSPSTAARSATTNASW